MADRADRSFFGTQEPDAISGARRSRSSARDVQDHPRRLHDLRAADAALGDGRRLGHAQARRLRPPDQRDPAGQGRAGVVPAGLLLPDPGRRPGDRLPDPDLRSVDDPRASRSATRSSGRSTAARTRRSSTTGSRRPARASAASTATSSAAATAATPTFNILNEHAADYQQTDGSGDDASERRTSFLMRGALRRRSATGCTPARTSTTPRASRSSSAISRTSCRRNNRSRNIGGNVTGNWGGYVLSATVDRNDTFYDEDSLTSTGGLPRIIVQPRRAPDRQVEDLLRRQQRVRDADLQDGQDQDVIRTIAD